MLRPNGLRAITYIVDAFRWIAEAGRDVYNTKVDIRSYCEAVERRLQEAKSTIPMDSLPTSSANCPKSP